MIIHGVPTAGAGAFAQQLFGQLGPQRAQRLALQQSVLQQPARDREKLLGLLEYIRQAQERKKQQEAAEPDKGVLGGYGSTGGAVIGGTAGALIGGPAGAMMGASLGSSFGGGIDAATGGGGDPGAAASNITQAGFGAYDRYMQQEDLMMDNPFYAMPPTGGGGVPGGGGGGDIYGGGGVGVIGVSFEMLGVG